MPELSLEGARRRRSAGHPVDRAPLHARLWEEGLAEPALAALRVAAEAGVSGAADALADAEGQGGRSEFARRIVLQLGAMLSAAARRHSALLDDARGRLEEVTPELN